jgi:hypothetical protein
VPPSSSSIDGDALVQGAQFQAFSQAPCHVCRSGYATADWPADWRFWFHGSPRENSRVIEGEEWQYQWLPTRTCRVVGFSELGAKTGVGDQEMYNVQSFGCRESSIVYLSNLTVFSLYFPLSLQKKTCSVHRSSHATVEKSSLNIGPHAWFY